MINTQSLSLRDYYSLPPQDYILGYSDHKKAAAAIFAGTAALSAVILSLIGMRKIRRLTGFASLVPASFVLLGFATFYRDYSKRIALERRIQRGVLPGVKDANNLNALKWLNESLEKAKTNIDSQTIDYLKQYLQKDPLKNLNSETNRNACYLKARVLVATEEYCERLAKPAKREMTKLTNLIFFNKMLFMFKALSDEGKTESYKEYKQKFNQLVHDNAFKPKPFNTLSLAKSVLGELA